MPFSVRLAVQCPLGPWAGGEERERGQSRAAHLPDRFKQGCTGLVIVGIHAQVSQKRLSGTWDAFPGRGGRARLEGRNRSDS